nr:hypothetical protein [Tanacetum cinerariifolium]
MLALGNYVQLKSICIGNLENSRHMMSQELKTVSYHKLYDILKQHQNEVNELRAERIALYHPQNHPTHYTQNSSTRSQQAAIRNRGKVIVNSSTPIYDQEPSMVVEDDEMSKDKEIDKLMALISLSFKKIYKPTNNNLRTSSNTSRVNQDNFLRINRGAKYDNQRLGNVDGARENVAYHKEKMLLCKQEEARFQLNARQADWKDDTDDESDDQKLEAHYMYMAKHQEVTPDAADNSGPIFDTEPMQQSQELKTVSYHKLYDILKQHQNEVNELRAERIARNANQLAPVAQKQLVYHPQNHPTHYTQNSSTRSQQAAIKNRGKVIVNSPTPIYDQEPSMVAEDDEMSKDKEIDKLMALISLSFKKIYKPTNNNLQTSSNTSNVDGARENVCTTVVQKYEIQCYNCKEYGHVARECQKPKRAKEAAYHKENMLLSHYMYMAKLQEVTPDAADNSGPIFDTEPMQQVQPNDNYNVFAIESEHLEQSQSIHDTYPIEQDEHHVIIDSLDMSYDREQIDQNDDDELDKNLTNEDFKTKNKSLESSNNHFKEANNELSKTNELMYNDIKKFQAELDRRNDVEYASKVETDCAKAKGDLISYKMKYQKSFNEYTQQINDLNQTILEIKKALSSHQETISILSQANDAQIKLYKTREDKEL